MHLDDKTFTTVIANTPLISIDLLVRNQRGEYLLGYRNNRPAKGYWFVPGGRILKDESMQSAFKRLMQEELGINKGIEEAEFLGPYEHFYQDYVFGEEHTTHYVVLGYAVSVDLSLSELPNKQHSKYRWFSKSEMLTNSDVHKHSSDYLVKLRGK